MAKNQFNNFQYLAVIRTLDSQYCHSPKSSFLRFFAELKHMIWNSTDGEFYFTTELENDLCIQIIVLVMHDEVSAADCGVLLGLPEFDSLRRRMEEKANLGQLDAFGLYVYGMVLNSGREKTKARKVLLESIRRFPFLWPAWKALLLCLPNNMEALFKGKNF